jgi:hypothetical protein
MPLLSVKPLSPSNITVTDNLVITTTQTDGGYAVVVTAGDELPVTKELFAQFQLGDGGFTAGDVKLPVTDAGTAVGGAFPSGAATLDLGLVPVKDSASPVLRPGDTLLTFQLSPAEGARSVSSAAPHGVTTRARNLALDNSGGNWVLSWDYTNPGDTNQDGEVGVQDLQAIGAHFHEQLKNVWADPLRHVDADANGEINLADVSSIGSNLKLNLRSYNIEMSQTGSEQFTPAGQLVLSDAQKDTSSGDTIRFKYDFAGQYVPHAWYRVVPVATTADGGEMAGAPSEAISEDGRMLPGVQCQPGQVKTITVVAEGLPAPITDLNACRVVFPASFDYVPKSFDPGAAGGPGGMPDGIWGSFADTLLLAPDAWMKPTDRPDGTRAIDFNVTVTQHHADAAPVGYGDLFSFQLKSNGSDPLTLSFETGEGSDVKRTYYCTVKANGDSEDHFFGNSLGFRVN